jgi:hypothetical protein
MLEGVLPVAPGNKWINVGGTDRRIANLKRLSLFLNLDPDAAYDILARCIIEDEFGIDSIPCMRSIVFWTAYEIYR